MKAILEFEILPESCTDCQLFCEGSGLAGGYYCAGSSKVEMHRHMIAVRNERNPDCPLKIASEENKTITPEELLKEIMPLIEKLECMKNRGKYCIDNECPLKVMEAMSCIQDIWAGEIHNRTGEYPKLQI